MNRSERLHITKPRRFTKPRVLFGNSIETNFVSFVRFETS